MRRMLVSVANRIGRIDFISKENTVKKLIGVLGLAIGIGIGLVGNAAAQTQGDLERDGKGGTTDNVLTYGMGYHQNRYSPLDQINKRNVRRLVPVWNLSLDNDLGEQAQPMIYDGVMYVSNARWTYAMML